MLAKTLNSKDKLAVLKPSFPRLDFETALLGASAHFIEILNRELRHTFEYDADRSALSAMLASQMTGMSRLPCWRKSPSHCGSSSPCAPDCL